VRSLCIEGKAGRMKSATEGNTIIVRLEDGEDLFQSLSRAAREHGAVSGHVVWGIGQLRDFELGYFDGMQYERRTFFEAYEVVSLHGSMTVGTDPPFHLHAALSSSDFAMVGGHLFRATVATVGEVCIEKFGRIQLGRELDGRTGLRKLTLR